MDKEEIISFAQTIKKLLKLEGNKNSIKVLNELLEQLRKDYNSLNRFTNNLL